MECNLRWLSLSKAMYLPKEWDGEAFNHIKVPIMDILAAETEKEFGWSYLSHEMMTNFQANRGMSHDMLKQC